MSSAFAALDSLLYFSNKVLLSSSREGLSQRIEVVAPIAVATIAEKSWLKPNKSSAARGSANAMIRKTMYAQGFFTL